MQDQGHFPLPHLWGRGQGWGQSSVLRTPDSRSELQVNRARKLRRNMTDGEKRLWRELRDFRVHYGTHVRRQVPIGPFVADLAVLRSMLVIEIDGEHHFTPNGLENAARRDSALRISGFRVLHINTGELAENFDGCVETILRELGLM